MTATASPPPIVLGSAQETLLIPLLGRAMESQRSSGLIHDPKAQQIVDSLHYDFSKWRGSTSVTACTLRTRMFDQEVQAFLDQHPDGTVVELGCGLNTRHERLHQGRAHWVEVDLPEVIAWRRQFFSDSACRRMVAADLRNPNWLAALGLGDGPHCFVSEAVLFYLPEAQVQAALSAMARGHPQSWLVMDTVAHWVVNTQAWHDAMRQLSPCSWFQWACNQPECLHTLGLQLKQSRTFGDCGAALMQQAPWPWPIYLMTLAWSGRSWLSGYRINRFELQTPD